MGVLKGVACHTPQHYFGFLGKSLKGSRERIEKESRERIEKKRKGVEKTI